MGVVASMHVCAKIRVRARACGGGDRFGRGARSAGCVMRGKRACVRNQFYFYFIFIFGLLVYRP